MAYTWARSVKSAFPLKLGDATSAVAVHTAEALSVLVPYGTLRTTAMVVLDGRVFYSQTHLFYARIFGDIVGRREGRQPVHVLVPHDAPVFRLGDD